MGPNVKVIWVKSSSHFWGRDLPWTGMGWWWEQNNAKFGKKRRFGKLTASDKKGEEAEGREIRGGGGWSRHGLQFLPDGRFIMIIPVPTFCASVYWILKKSADCTIKTNTYIVLCMNYFCCYGSPILPVPLNPNFTFPFDENSCQRNSFRYCGYPIFPVPLNLNFTFPFEANSCQRRKNSCQWP